MKLGVDQAGFIPDIGANPNLPMYRHCKSDISTAPIPRTTRPGRRLVAPVSTVLFVPKVQQEGAASASHMPSESNIPKDKHFTDCPAPGTIVLMQQPEGQVCALLGDLVASRLQHRGVAAAVIDGRVRDIASCGDICDQSDFQVWSKGISAVGTGLQAKPWAIDISLDVGGIIVQPGDIMVADEADRGVVVIPKDKFSEVLELLPELKQADDNVLKDVHAGVDLGEAFRRHRGHYTNSK